MMFVYVDNPLTWTLFYYFYYYLFIFYFILLFLFIIFIFIFYYFFFFILFYYFFYFTFTHHATLCNNKKKNLQKYQTSGNHLCIERLQDNNKDQFRVFFCKHLHLFALFWKGNIILRSMLLVNGVIVVYFPPVWSCVFISTAFLHRWLFFTGRGGLIYASLTTIRWMKTIISVNIKPHYAQV